MPQWTLRLSDELAQDVQRASEERGFSTVRGFVRDALRKEVQAHGEAAQNVEKRIAASLDRLTRELHKLENTQQAQFALMDALAKAFFTCVPEPPGDVIDQARRRAVVRHEKFIKSVAAAMTGGSRAALHELTQHEE